MKALQVIGGILAGIAVVALYFLVYGLFIAVIIWVVIQFLQLFGVLS